MKIAMTIMLDPGVTDLGASELGREIAEKILEEFEDDVLTIEVVIEGHGPKTRLNFNQEIPEK